VEKAEDRATRLLPVRPVLKCIRMEAAVITPMREAVTEAEAATAAPAVVLLVAAARQSVIAEERTAAVVVTAAAAVAAVTAVESATATAVAADQARTAVEEGDECSEKLEASNRANQTNGSLFRCTDAPITRCPDDLFFFM
jgi:hypothetical protein